jgi:hypothetical protein
MSCEVGEREGASLLLLNSIIINFQETRTESSRLSSKRWVFGNQELCNNKTGSNLLKKDLS